MLKMPKKYPLIFPQRDPREARIPGFPIGFNLKGNLKEQPEKTEKTKKSTWKDGEEMFKISPLYSLKWTYGSQDPWVSNWIPKTKENHGKQTQTMDKCKKTLNVP